ncbi:MAG: type II CAAX prenyl endopeptidase Rce1 family protein [Bacteroidia bacterium]
MPETNWKKINQFLLIAFGISWASALMMRFSQIQYGSGEAITIIALLYMPAPALAAILVQKFFWNGSLAEFGFTLKGVSWKWLFLFTPIIYLVFFLGSLAAIYFLGNKFDVSLFGYLDFSNEHFREFIKKALEAQGKDSSFQLEKLMRLPINYASLVLVAGIIAALIAGYTLNLPFTFGEELGWRGLLQKETQPWGFWKSNLFIGSIWGLWHGPIIMMGHNYPNYPILGIGMMVLFCVSVSFVQSYIRFKTKTIFGPSAFHGMINASAGMSAMLIASPNELFGSIAGIAGMIGALLMLIYILIFDRKFISDFRNFESTPPV